LQSIPQNAGLLASDRPRRITLRQLRQSWQENETMGMKTLLAGAALAASMAIAAIAEEQASLPCSAPQAPELPAAETKLEFEVIDAMGTALEAYTQAEKTYRACLNDVTANASDHGRDVVLAALAAYEELGSLQIALWEKYDAITEKWSQEQERLARQASEDQRLASAVQVAQTNVNAEEVVNLRR
jgi:hypothetical protein